MREELGIGSNKEILLDENLSKLLIEHTKYISNLSKWDQYIIWRYTIGSGQVNKLLIGIENVESSKYWVYQFFYYCSLELKYIDSKFLKWKQYFLKPKLILSLNIDSNKTIKFLEDVIIEYTFQLQIIILNAPTVQTPIIVYKASTPYDGVPQYVGAKNITVPQILFNSTTYDPQLNFNMFLPADSTCCLWKLTIERNSHVLFINNVFHAFPSEREILLPIGTIFDVTNSKTIDFKYSEIKGDIKQDFKLIQNKPFTIGEVYRSNPIICPEIKSKKMLQIEANVRTTLS